MAIERWTDERLDNLASTVSELRTSTSELSTSVTELRVSATETRLTAEALLQTVVIHQSNFETLVTEIRDIKSELRGLRTETHRILDHLFGEQTNNE
ncbi:hypothetical protein [Synechocystis sp. PCC 7509]|uniref:hypothetical protein n=1 Tax=Synechocystis sp. PCC 7509 TaxID=927677 RepID=UPI0002ABC8A2|nr:hypothetical protein [Synechocystis sp. PCC 7509]